MEEYKINKNFRSYLDKYCKKHKISTYRALTHAQVKNVEEYYRNKRLNIVEV